MRRHTSADPQLAAGARTGSARTWRVVRAARVPVWPAAIVSRIENGGGIPGENLDGFLNRNGLSSEH
jgi:hypothetical protein